MGQVGKVDPALKMAALKPYLTLMDDKAFKAWLKTLEGELDLLREWSWQVGEVDRFGKFDAALTEMKMMRPTNQQEIMQLWMCFRAVSNYWNAKLQELESMRLKYEFLEKQLKMLNTIEAKDKGKGEKK
jgi:hypothetical protein